MSAKSRNGSREPIEFKGTTLPVVNVLLHSLDPIEASAALEKRLGRTPDFFAGDAAVLDISPVRPAPEKVDWAAFIALLRRYKLSPVAARASGELAAAARAAGLAILDDADAPVRTAAVAQTSAAAAANQTELFPQGESAPTTTATPPPVASAPTPPPTAAASTLIVDKPLRSGQQIYARGGDLVILAMVSAGAEVIADGSIHVYAPLRGRALAGARGNQDARIFATRFEAELVSVAGVYRTFERGVSAEVAGKPAQVRLAVHGDRQSLSVEALNIG